MSAVIRFDSINTDQLRAAIVALRHELLLSGPPSHEGAWHDVPRNGTPQGTIGVNGPDCWVFTTPRITPAQAAMVAHAIAEARPAGLTGIIGAAQPIRVGA